MTSRRRIPAALAPAAMTLALLCAVPTPAHAAQSAPPTPAEPPSSVRMAWGVKVPMRDGVALNATIYRPADATGPLPVIFTLTPYIGDTYHPRAMYFASNGYVFALVDCRGRGNSGGTFEPFANEGRDGHDVVEWLASQPWSNGKVGMWGGSYAGYDQWATLKEAPPHLVTVVPAAAVYPGADFPMFQNVFSSYVAQWLTYTSGVTGNGNLFGEDRYWTDAFWERYRTNRPYRELAAITGTDATNFARFLVHPTPDTYWDAMVPTREQYARMNVPILTITGHYDGDQTGALRYYREFMAAAPAEVRARHYLIIGPWDHAGTRTPRKEVGGLTFGDASMLDLNALHKAWYDWTMKGGPKPEFLKAPVAYYVTGSDTWTYTGSLDAIATSTRTYYLDSRNGQAGDVFASGTLVAAPAASAPDSWTYDPLDTRPGELDRKPAENYLTDQTGVMNLFGAGVVYHSAPFAEDVEFSGTLALTAWLEMDVPDTDIGVGVYEVLPNGSAVLLSSDVKRARYRESLREEKLVTPGVILPYRFDSFTFVSRRIAKGSRLRLVIGSTNSIGLQKNYNSAKPVADQSGADARTARIWLYHDAKHPSALAVPVREGTSK